MTDVEDEADVEDVVDLVEDLIDVADLEEARLAAMVDIVLMVDTVVRSTSATLTHSLLSNNNWIVGAGFHYRDILILNRMVR